MVPEVRSICIGVHCVKEYPKQLSIEWEEKRDQIPEDFYPEEGPVWNWMMIGIFVKSSCMNAGKTYSTLQSNSLSYFYQVSQVTFYV